MSRLEIVETDRSKENKYINSFKFVCTACDYASNQLIHFHAHFKKTSKNYCKDR